MTAFPSVTAVTFNFTTNSDPLPSPWLANTYTGGTSNLLKALGGVCLKNQIAAAGFGMQVLGTSYGPDMEMWFKIVSLTATNAQEIFASFLRLQQDGAATVDGYVVYSELAAGADTWHIDRLVNGSQTNLANATQNIAAGDYVGAKVEDSGGNPVVTGYWCPAANDPTLVASWTQVLTTTDSNVAKITGTGRVGLEVQGIVTTFDDMRSGTIVASAARTTSDTVTVSDAVARSSLTLARTAPTTVTVSDAATRTQGAQARTTGDTVTVSDAANKASVALATTGDTVTISDAVTRLTANPRTASDSSSVSDAAVRASTSWARISGDTVTVSDTASRTQSAQARATSDTVSVSHAATRTTSLPRTAVAYGSIYGSWLPIMIEPRVRIPVSDRVTVGSSRTASDSFSVSHAVTRTSPHLRTTGDTTTVSDAASRALQVFARTANGSFLVSDFAENSSSGELIRVASDTVDVADAVERMVISLARSAADSIIFSDEAVGEIEADFDRTAADFVTVVDSATRSLQTSRSAEDLVTITSSAVASDDTVEPTRPNRAPGVHLLNDGIIKVKLV